MKPRHSFRVPTLLLLLASLAWLPGVSGAAPAGAPLAALPEEPTPADADLAHRIRGRLAVDPDFEVRAVLATVLDGIVTLRGYVSTEEQKERAADAAAFEDGVVFVVNEIVVDPYQSPAPSKPEIDMGV